MRRCRPLALALLTAAASTLGAGPVPTTGVRCDVWPVPDGGAITDTLSGGDDLGKPAQTRQLPAFELDPAPADGHVCGLAATLTPPATGDYTFRVAGDDTAVLFLGPVEKPKELRAIASVPSYTASRDFANYAAQTSRPVHLDARRPYRLVAWLQNAAGASHVSVQWTLPDGTTESPIPAARLTPMTGPLRLPAYDAGPVPVTLKPDAVPLNRPGFHKLVDGARCALPSGPLDVSYLLDVPPRFDATTDRRPLLVFLHGNGHQGADLWGAMNEGPADFLSHDAALQSAVPMLVLVPQLPVDWRWDSPGAAAMVNGLVRQVCDRYPRIDRRRVYLTGLSMGGKGAWLTALDSPELYAAVATFSAVAVRPKAAGKRLASIPHLHITCGGDDGDFAAGSAAMYAALRPALGTRVDLTTVPNEGHGVWHRYYADPAFYRDLMKYSR